MQLLQTATEKLKEDPDSKEAKSMIVGYVMTQMHANAGIRKHGKKAIDALFQEFAQLDDQTVFKGVHASSLTKTQRKAALRAINLIKEKRCGKIKGRTCADGRSQRELYEKHETSSPTISTESLLISLIIDALEERDVAVADVVGAYLKAYMKDFVLLKLTGQTVGIITEVNPKYKEFVTYEKGKPVLYLQLLKALYGCVQSGLLWYELFSTTLQDMGFKLNPYEPCIANNMIDGHQCTIGWYVDDTKISHKDPNTVTKVIEKIEEKFGKMQVSRGKKHNFLGIDIEFPGDKTVKISMVPYLKEAIEEFGETVEGTVGSSGAKNLFEVNERSPPLTEDKKKVFHSIVAKLAYVAHRSRSDLLPTISFLCTRVSKSTEQDWTKLKRLIQFVKQTVEDPCYLGADKMSRASTWVDAAYAPHPDMKSHSGGGISFGRGIIIPKSTKQKLNTKSSTEAELVAASDYISNTIWVQNFLKEQGYIMEENIFYQDNESAIKLEKNGRSSAGQKSKHINIRYFFIKDRIKNENIGIVHCPTDKMIGDFYSKPTQGGLFHKFRNVILGYEHTDSLTRDPPLSQTEERVENSKFTNNEGQTKKVTGTTGSEIARSKRSYAEVARTKSNEIVSFF